MFGRNTILRRLGAFLKLAVAAMALLALLACGAGDGRAGALPHTAFGYVLKAANHRVSNPRRPTAHHRAEHAGTYVHAQPNLHAGAHADAQPDRHSRADADTHPDCYAVADGHSCAGGGASSNLHATTYLYALPNCHPLSHGKAKARGYS